MPDPALLDGYVALAPNPAEADDDDLAEDTLTQEEEAEVAAIEDERARAFLAGGAYATVSIDRYDDLPAIFGKIDSAASPRVALVAARGNQELNRSLSIRRLQRHLDRTGKDLILVTRSRALRQRAREERLPAAGSLRRVNFRTAGRRGLLGIALPSLGALVALVVLAAALAGGAALLLWYVPTADITVLLPAQQVDGAYDLVFDTQIRTPDLAAGVVPATRRRVTVTRTLYRQATGTVNVPTDHAGIGLRFTNRTNAPVTVPAGTVVTAQNGVRFTTSSDIELPRLNAAADVIALAQVPGAIGNVPVNSANRVEGPLANSVSVANPAPGEKGTDVQKTGIAEGDVEGIRAYINDILIDAARQDLVRTTPDDTPVPQSAQVGTVELTPVPGIGAVGSYTEVTVTAEVSMLVATADDLRAVYLDRLRPQIGADQTVLDSAFTTRVERAGPAEQAFDRMPVSVHTFAQVVPLLDRATVREAVAGKNKEEATQALGALYPDSPPAQIKVSPSWAPRLPRKGDRIDITVAAAP